MAIGLNSEIHFHVFKAYFLDAILTLGSLDSVHFQDEWKKNSVVYVLWHINKNSLLN